MDAQETIRTRRSISRLVEPAPTDDELRLILEAAVCAPDHEELRPWRFVVLSGQAKEDFGQVLHDTYVERCRLQGVTPTDGQLNKERTKLGRAPLVVVAVAVRNVETAIPWIEQQLAVGAACQNALLACASLGYGGMWRTGDPAYDSAVISALGFEGEAAIIAFLYIGTPTDMSTKPPHDPSLDGVVTHWTAG